MSAWLILAASVLSADASGSWPAFRGDGNSVVASESLPLRWSEKENITWSIPLTGYGQSSPIVWQDSVYVTSVEGEQKDKVLVTAYDLKTGDKKWQHTAEAAIKIKSSDYVSRAAPTPTADADGVYAFFESGDLVALDHAGKVSWTRSLVKDYGEFQGNHGLGTSVVATADSVILLIDHAGPSYLVSFAKKDGTTRWKSDRDSRTSWSTPIVVPSAENSEIVISSNGVVEGYAAADGKRLWWLSGLKGNTVASPTIVGDLVIVGSGDKGQSLALRRSPKGELGETDIAWRAETATSSFGSPLIHRDRVYFVSKAGVGYCLDVKTGKELWNLRLGDTCWASPVGAGDRVYFFMKGGETIVFKAGSDQAEEIARNPLADMGRLYGVAIAENSFILRGGEKLVRIGNK